MVGEVTSGPRLCVQMYTHLCAVGSGEGNMRKATRGQIPHNFGPVYMFIAVDLRLLWRCRAEFATLRFSHLFPVFLSI